MQVPSQLLQSLKGIKGFDKDAFEKVHASGEQVTSVRFNPLKAGSADHLPIQKKIPWSSNGYYLKERPSFTFDPLFHAGVYYVQEASGMFLEQALTQTADLSKPLKVLDLCAAPGGKSTLIQSIISPDSLLVSNEVIRSRAIVLQENMIKWGASNVIVTNNDPVNFSVLENYFDIVVADAPCSGSGLFRKEPEAVNEWSEDNVALCSQRQQRILADIWPALKKDGVLIYSTCSYSKEENEDISDWLAESFDVESLPLAIDPLWRIEQTISGKHANYGYRFYPDKVEGEGFFIACFRKNEGAVFSYPKPKHSREINKQEEAIVNPYLNSKEPPWYFKHNDSVYALPFNFQDDLYFLKARLYIKKAGVLMGKLTAKELIPEHELALSSIISSNILSIDVGREQAIQYLRKEEMKIGNPGKGWAIVQFEGYNLGWIKMLGNRINNYYPKEWRILKRD